jgi:DNA repair protein RecO
VSYHIYTTEGIILKKASFGEANLLLHVLTEDLGLIIASAQAARVSNSKLRPALQEFTHVSVSCVKGKNGWKITNVVEKGSFYFNYPQYSHKVLAQVSQLLLQMMPGESPHREIFQTVRSGFEFLKNISERETSGFEMLIVLRVLYHLGYVVRNATTETFLVNTNEWNSDLVYKTGQNKQIIITFINKALKESQL